MGYNLQAIIEKQQTLAQRILTVAPVAYICAEFSGGTGSQSTIAWSEGSRVFSLVHSQDAINVALRFFEVQINGAHDEFDRVQLIMTYDDTEHLP